MEDIINYRISDWMDVVVPAAFKPVHNY